MTGNSQTGSIIVMGDLMIDICAPLDSLDALTLSRGSDLPSSITFDVGGSAANTASWLAAAGNSTYLLGAVGSDSMGETINSRLSQPNLHLKLQQFSEHPTGTCIVITESSGERTMIPSAGANAHLSIHQLFNLWAQVPGPRHLHVSGYALFHEVAGATTLVAMEHARSVGMSISFDPSAHTLVSSHSDRIRSALALANILLANEQEATALAQILLGQPALAAEKGILDLAGKLRGLLCAESIDPVAVITLGPRGAIAASSTTEAVPAAEVAVGHIRSTTGAGDAFNAGFLGSWLTGAAVVPALEAGVTLASQALSRVGASPYALD